LKKLTLKETWHLLPSEDDLRVLTEIGFTKAQAKLYLTLIRTGKMDAKTLAKQAMVPRQAVYRTLGELQNRGIVEKIIALPQEYKAVPIQDGLSIMLSAKAKEYTSILEKTEEFLSKFDAEKEKEPADSDYTISIVEGKETIIKRTKYATDHTQKRVCCCSTLQRWIHVNQEIYPNVKKALERGVKYRMVLEISGEGDICLPKELKAMISHPNYQIALTCDQLKSNAAIFDWNEASFNFYPSKAIAESPMIWTNHPSLLIGFQDHFEKLWTTAEEWSGMDNSKRKSPT
jgi:sugar-specific transcriptional regulator TrmB